jgi:hypothetical protein
MNTQRRKGIESVAINAAMLVAGFAAGYWYATKSAYEIVREALAR